MELNILWNKRSYKCQHYIQHFWLCKYLKQTLEGTSLRKQKSDINRGLLIYWTVNEFLDILTSNWFTPQILGPTRFVEHNKPWLVDNIFVNFSDMDFTLGNIMEKITDRLPNFLIIESLKTKLDSKVKTLKINLLHFTLEKLKNGILALNL